MLYAQSGSSPRSLSAFQNSREQSGPLAHAVVRGAEAEQESVEFQALSECSAVAPESVAIADLLPSDSPRVIGEDPEHIRALAEVDTQLPPIIVHRPTMRVIDGMHRIRAAELRGEAEISVKFFDGNVEDAFLVSVRINNTHGLPLSQADRSAAICRLVKTHPNWSDRRLALATGLSAKTIAAVRRRLSGPDGQSTARVGLDGRVRPLSSAEARRLACKVMTEQPEASLRDIAKAAGIAIATARDVRERVRKGQDPVPLKLRESECSTKVQENDEGAGESKAEPIPQPGAAEILQVLRRDPSLRFSEFGRGLLRMLSVQSLSSEEWEKLAAQVPEHLRGRVAEAAKNCATSWLQFAENLKEEIDV